MRQLMSAPAVIFTFTHVRTYMGGVGSTASCVPSVELLRVGKTTFLLFM